MFGFLSEMMAGQHEALPRRRASGGIAYGRRHENGEFESGFFAEETVEHDRWLGRGELPGAHAADDLGNPNGVSVADEMRELALRGGPGRAGDGAGRLEVAGPAVPAKHAVVANHDVVARK